MVRKTIGVVTRVAATGTTTTSEGTRRRRAGQPAAARATIVVVVVVVVSLRRRDRRVSGADGPKAPSSQLKRSRGKHRFWLGWIRREELRVTIDKPQCAVFFTVVRTRSRARRITRRFSGPRRTSRRCWVR